ncbi:MAG: VIT domain-containing protein [Parcubacteria group bacterium]|jgi:hypothetical protein
MLEIIIEVLLYIKQKKWMSGITSYLFGVLLLLGIGSFWFSAISEGVISESSKFFNISYYALSALVVFLVIKSIIQNYKKGLSEASFFSAILARILPITISFFTIFIIIDEKRKIEEIFNFENIIFILPLLALYPILEFMDSFKFFDSKNLFQKIFSFSKKYNAGLVIIIPIILVISGFFSIVMNYKYIDFQEILMMLLFFIIPFIFFAIIFSVLYSILTAEERSMKKILISGLLGCIISFIVPLIIWGTDSFLDRQISQAGKILLEEGENQSGFKKVQGINFLEKAFISQYKGEGARYSRAKKDLFSKIFDDTLENSIQTKINPEEFRNFRTNKTSALAKNEDASVLLNYAEYNSFFYSKINTLETTIIYEFQNTKNNNQEVIFNIRLPKAESIVSDLKLGLNLEKQGTVAPRGAAEKVYQESMRRNIDPALISQVGPNTYRLRVYPVSSKTDKQTQGRQKVQITYLTPLDSFDKIIIAPAIETLNLSITENTKAVVRAQRDGVLISEEQINKDQEQFFSSSKELNEKLVVKDEKFCLALNDLENLMSVPYFAQQGEQLINADDVLNKRKDYFTQNLPARNSELTENIVFFDISKSAGNQKDTRNIYKEINKIFKDQRIPFQVKLFNFAIYPTTDDFDNLEFWGYTDTGKVIEYLSANKISGKRILIVTDDTNFEFNTKENKNIDYQALNSNLISVLQVGKKIRAQKDVLTKTVLASGGVFEIIDSASDVSKKKDIILDRNRFSINLDNCVFIGEDLAERKILEKIQAGQVDDLLLANIKNEQNWMQIAQTSAKIAQRYQVINLFSSFIALETQQQKMNLDKYSKENERYDVEYENFDSNSNNQLPVTFDNPIGTGLPSGSFGFPFSSNLSAEMDDSWGDSPTTTLSAGTIMSSLPIVAIFLLVGTFLIVFIIGFVAVKHQRKIKNIQIDKNDIQE